MASEEDFKIDSLKRGKGTAFGHSADVHSRTQALALYKVSVRCIEP